MAWSVSWSRAKEDSQKALTCKSWMTSSCKSNRSRIKSWTYLWKQPKQYRWYIAQCLQDPHRLTLTSCGSHISPQRTMGLQSSMQILMRRDIPCCHPHPNMAKNGTSPMCSTETRCTLWYGHAVWFFLYYIHTLCKYYLLQGNASWTLHSSFHQCPWPLKLDLIDLQEAENHCVNGDLHSMTRGRLCTGL